MYVVDAEGKGKGEGDGLLDIIEPDSVVLGFHEHACGFLEIDDQQFSLPPLFCLSP